MQHDEAEDETSEPRETRWLIAAEMRAWLAFWSATRLVDGALDRDLRSMSGLSHADYQILAMLSQAPEQRLRMSALAEVVLISRSRLTYQVTQLEQAGLVRREECPSDKRGAMAVLTAEGFAALEAAAPGHVASVRRVFFDALSPEQVAVLGGALTTIVERLLDQRERSAVPHLWGLQQPATAGAQQGGGAG